MFLQCIILIFNTVKSVKLIIAKIQTFYSLWIKKVIVHAPFLSFLYPPIRRADISMLNVLFIKLMNLVHEICQTKCHKQDHIKNI